MEKICKNCRLFNKRDKLCGVIVMLEGEKYQLPVHPKDPCHWDRLDNEINAQITNEIGKRKELGLHRELEKELYQPIAIQQIRIFNDGTKNFIESPDDI